MRGVVVRSSDNKVMSIIEADDQDVINANIPTGCVFISDVDVDRKRIAYAYYVNNSLSYTKTENELSLIDQWASLRQLRDELLTKSDFTQFSDSPLSDSKKAEWATYRQQLRDLPANTSDPSSPNYPSPPS